MQDIKGPIIEADVLRRDRGQVPVFNEISYRIVKKILVGARGFIIAKDERCICKLRLWMCCVERS